GSMQLRQLILCFAVGLASAGAANAQDAQNYPDRPITVVLGVAPGGNTEVEVREFLARVGRSMGQNFVFVHKPGAGGDIGADFVVKAKPDGYTLLAAAANLTTPPEPGQTRPFDAFKDLAPVSVLTRYPTVLMVHPSVPANNVKEYFDYARANPGKLNFA